jgi:Asp-tRNA(Asn)/Glu-tRNA(Gln) amidotransferase A subunit family amidase
VSNDGVYRLTESFDSLGGMGKSVADLAAVTEMLMSTAKDTTSPPDFQSSMRTNWDGLAVGFIDLDSRWKLPENMMHTDEAYINQTVGFCSARL